MKVSPQKRAANRRNALKSTGPKTSVGRRSSALNSIRHGLSVPLPQAIIEPLQKELAELIVRDGIEPETAYDLAQKIIEYERNLLNLQKIYEKEVTRLNDGSYSGFMPTGRPDEFEKILANVQTIDTTALDKDERVEMKLLAQMCKIIVRADKSDVANTRRYFKRSSNQLIKALKRL